MPVLLFFLIGLAAAGIASGQEPLRYICYRASAAPVVDGRLDDAAWLLAPWTSYFVDIEGDRKPAPRFRTRVKMLWDDQAFYVAAEMEEPHVWASLTQHDAVICMDNDFEVFIDPDGDHHEYYELELNPFNTTWDLFLPKPYRDGGQAVNAWEIRGLRTAVHVDGTLNNPADTDRGWSVEIALPWEALREYAHRPSPPRDGDSWRVNFSRVEWKHRVVNGRYEKIPDTREDNWVWSPQGLINMHYPEHWGYVQFSTRRQGEAAARPDPTAAARRALLQIYYAQAEFRRKNKRWATPDELPAHSFWMTADGWRAETTARGARETDLRVAIRQDSKIEVLVPKPGEIP